MPRGGFDGIREICFERCQEAVEAAIAALSAARLLKRSPRHVRILLHGAQDIEADHVAAALPNRIDRRLAVQSRHYAIVYVTIAAEAFHRLQYHGRSTF